MAPRYPAPELPGFVPDTWLGGGGFADVFRYQDSLGRYVAVKVLHRGVDGNAQASFEAEANLMAKLSNHPNIVSIFTSGVASDGRPYLVMEICPPPHLGNKIAKRPLSVDKAMEIAVQISGAIETAHRLGILHRDVKPANILFTEFGRPALTDFGISAPTDADSLSRALSPLWAPPEQFRRAYGQAGPASDVFSLASTVWAMLAGRSPMAIPGGDNSTLALRDRVPKMPAPSTGRADVPQTLEQILSVAMSKDPAHRYQSALEFARAIQGVQAQLNHSVTQIDVLADPSFVDDDEDLTETGTRVSDFILIDPEASDTSSTSAPNSGVTTPEDLSVRRASSDYDSDVHVVSANVAQHGRGVAQPAIRDFTGPAIPELLDQTETGDGSQTAADPGAKKTSSWRIASIVAIVLVIIGAIAIAAVFVKGGAGTDPEQDATSKASSKAQNPIDMRVPPVEDLEGIISGDQVEFTWTNPAENPGDDYLYRVLDPAVDNPLESTTDTKILVPKSAGQTCVEVSLHRANGRTSEPKKACVKS